MSFCYGHGWPYKDERGCWKCIDELRIAGKLQEKASKAKKLYFIPKVSQKKAARERELAKVRKEKKHQVRFCQSCGSTQQPLDYSHVLSVKQFPKYESHPDNAVIECRACHSDWENGTLADKMKQHTWPKKLAFILKYEPAYFNKLQLKTLNKAA